MGYNYMENSTVLIIMHCAYNVMYNNLDCELLDLGCL